MFSVLQEGANYGSLLETSKRSSQAAEVLFSCCAAQATSLAWDFAFCADTWIQEPLGWLKGRLMETWAC